MLLLLALVLALAGKPDKSDLAEASARSYTLELAVAAPERRDPVPTESLSEAMSRPFPGVPDHDPPPLSPAAAGALTTVAHIVCAGVILSGSYCGP